MMVFSIPSKATPTMKEVVKASKSANASATTIPIDWRFLVWGKTGLSESEHRLFLI